MLLRSPINRLTALIIEAAIAVHRALGPGLLESAYLTCLIFELKRRGLRVDVQRPVPLNYCGLRLECGYRLMKQGVKRMANNRSTKADWAQPNVTT